MKEIIIKENNIASLLVYELKADYELIRDDRNMIVYKFTLTDEDYNRWVNVFKSYKRKELIVNINRYNQIRNDLVSAVTKAKYS